MTAATTTETLAGWVSALSYEGIPGAVRDRVKDILLDTFASALAGNSGDEVGQIDAVARAFGGPATDATVIGRAPSSAVGAALMNGYLITAATVCDVHRPTLCHVTPEVVPPAMATAERLGADGQHLIAAIAAGLEVTTRIGLGLDYPIFRAHGWHSPGVIGPFGGAASAGKLLGLDPIRQRHALGLAGSQSAGTFAHWGTPTIKFHQSRGAMSGLLAAFLAETGFQAAPDILGAADGGLFSAYAEGGNGAVTIERLGDHWELMNISLRMWPVASSIQAMVTALFAILADHPVRPDEVVALRIRLSETVYRMHGELGWDTRFRALLSVRYVASVIVHDRACWLPQFLPERIDDDRLDAFARERIVVEIDPQIATNAATIELTTTAGQVLVEHRDLPRGDAADPLSRDEIANKFRVASREWLAEDEVEGMIKQVSQLETVQDVVPLLRALRPAPATGRRP